MTTIKEQLQSITGVTNWESINFSILPDEDPKGFMFPLAINPESPSRSIVTYGVGIAISSSSLEGLTTESLLISNTIARSFSTRAICSDEGIIRLVGSIELEPPQSYPQQSNVSLTTGFFTAITFSIEVG